MKKQIDDRREALIFPTAREAIDSAVEDFIRIANQAIMARGQFLVALSGGSTPKAIYQTLADEKHRNRIDWSHVHLYWSDERCVPPTDPESNYRMAMDAGFASLPIPSENIHRMKGELEPLEAAAGYELQIKKMGAPFDLVMLGMGPDGHTASLFPNTSGLGVTDRLVIANFIPQKNSWRLTFTFPLINQGRQITVYALGKEKAEILAEVLANDPNQPLPAMRVGTPQSKALWILDAEAFKDKGP